MWVADFFDVRDCIHPAVLLCGQSSVRLLTTPTRISTSQVPNLRNHTHDTGSFFCRCTVYGVLSSELKTSAVRPTELVSSLTLLQWFSSLRKRSANVNNATIRQTRLATACSGSRRHELTRCRRRGNAPHDGQVPVDAGSQPGWPSVGKLKSHKDQRALFMRARTSIDEKRILQHGANTSERSREAFHYDWRDAGGRVQVPSLRRIAED